MILPSNNSLSEITRVFRLIQEAMNSKIPTTTVIDNTKTTTVNKTVNTGTPAGNYVPTTRAISTTAPLAGGGDLGSDRTLSITQAGTSSNGYLSSTDWNTFNGKQAALGFTPANDTAVVHNTGNETGLAGNKTWTGIATFSNSTGSTSTTTGAVVVTGGVGIGGAVNCGALTATTGAFSANAAINGPVNSNAALNIGAGYKITSATGATQHGLLADICGNTSGTSGAVAGGFRARSDAAAYASIYLMGVKVYTPVIGVGSTVTANYGLYIENQLGAGTNNYAIYTNSGLLRFGDAATFASSVSMGALTATTGSFTSSTTSSSTTTGALKVTGGIGCADYVTSKYRSSDGTAGLTDTRTFYAASSSGGTVNVLNTVTIKDGIITAWTQA